MTGLRLRSLKKSSWYLFLGANLSTTYVNALNLVHYSNSNLKVHAFVLTLLIQFYVFLVVQRDVRVPYLFPRLKWWESGVAGMSQITTRFRSGTDSEEFDGLILDLNAKGCFLKTPKEMKLGEVALMSFQAFGHELMVPARVVWQARSTVTHPRGLGLEFYKLNKQTQRKLKIVSKRFEKWRKSSGGPAPTELPSRSLA